MINLTGWRGGAIPYDMCWLMSKTPQERYYLRSTTKVPRPGKVWMSPSERRMSRA
jgi:hypothetical protein